MTDTKFQRLKAVEPIICADAILNVTFERADVAAMLRFSEDFGLIRRSEQTGGIFLRGHGRAPYLVALEPSTRNQFVGMSFVAKSEADLERLAAATGAPVEPLATPGGGRRVALHDPWGLEVSVVHGIEWDTPLDCPHTEFPINTPQRKARVNTPVRTPLRPSPLFKLGHVVLQRPDFQAAAAWYMRHLGLIPSDVQCLPDGQPALGFFRLNRGAEPADHHTLALLAARARISCTSPSRRSSWTPSVRAISTCRQRVGRTSGASADTSSGARCSTTARTPWVMNGNTVRTGM